MIRRRLPAGSIVHVCGLPFNLPYDTVIEGHEANFAILDRPVVHQQVPDFSMVIENIRRPWWKRMFGL